MYRIDVLGKDNASLVEKVFICLFHNLPFLKHIYTHTPV